jgi:hypothetical protein
MINPWVKRVVVSNVVDMPYYFRISENLRGDSGAVIWEGVPLYEGTLVTLPLVGRGIRVTIYNKKPHGDKAEKVAENIGYVVIGSKDIKNLKKMGLIVYVGTTPSALHKDHIRLEFEDGSMQELDLKS